MGKNCRSSGRRRCRAKSRKKRERERERKRGEGARAKSRERIDARAKTEGADEALETELCVLLNAGHKLPVFCFLGTMR